VEVRVLTQDNYIKAKIVETAWRFLKSYVGTGHLAGQMIMHTLANRVRCGWGSWLQTLDSVPKFMAENELPPLVHPAVWDATFVKLLQTVDGIYEGSVQDMSRGALYWAELSKIERPWFRDTILHGRKFVNISNGGVEMTEVPAHPSVANTNGLTFWN
jgi:hypothetical protein